MVLKLVLTLQMSPTFTQENVRVFHAPDPSRLPFAFLSLGSTTIIDCMTFLFVCYIPVT